jgi:hypothetical protein
MKPKHSRAKLLSDRPVLRDPHATPDFRPSSELSGEEPTFSEVRSEVLANLARASMRRRISGVANRDGLIHKLSTEMELRRL